MSAGKHDLPNGSDDPLAGLYELVSSDRCDEHGESVSLVGSLPLGQTWYGNGRMWVLIAPGGRPSISGTDPPGQDDFASMLRGVIGYYGSYCVDQRTSTVTHHVEAAINPAWVGKAFVRRYHRAGDLLTLVIGHPPHTIETIYRRLDMSAISARLPGRL